MKLAMILFIAAVTLASYPRAGASTAKPIVGAIRWDGWFKGNPWEKNLQSPQWRYRLPFYAKVNPDGKVEVCEDSQEVMDREIRYASDAGLDYWAFCYYHPKSWPEADCYNYGWKRYLASKLKRRMHFCLNLQWGHLGPADEWPKTVETFVRMFKERTYQRVAGGRPLVFFFNWDYLERQFGSVAAARKAMDELRAASVKAGAGSPYIVAQVFAAADGAKYVDELGFDAIGAYSAPGGGEAKECPYSDLAATNVWYWNSFKATGKKVVPLVNAGWDGRPRDYKSPWYANATPEEVAANLRSASRWIEDNPKSVDANTVLIYAWNESDEGGWLVPTQSEGTKRLGALRK